MKLCAKVLHAIHGTVLCCGVERSPILQTLNSEESGCLLIESLLFESFQFTASVEMHIDSFMQQ